MPIWVPFVWYFLGMVGCALAWFERTHWKYGTKYEFLCPTPKVIFFTLFGSLFGGAALVCGLLIVATSDNIGQARWWNRPICKRSDD